MTLCLGMSSPYVKTVQQLLAGLSFYRGPIDSVYGGGTYAAVKNYQIAHGLQPSGTVDATTWAAMFPGLDAPVSDLLTRPLSERCLALTGSFETSTYPPESFCGLCGDFDQMGISFGVCQWNIGQGTLQPLLQQMFEQHTEIAKSIFHENFDILASLGAAQRMDQLTFARSIQSKGMINEPWRGMFLALGRTPEFQAIQSGAASSMFARALSLCQQFTLKSERAAALMFDVLTQNGSIVSSAGEAIHKSIGLLPPDADTEVARLVIVSEKVADAAAPEHVADVRTRKLAVAEGEGVVHGRYYDLGGMFGIRLTPYGS